jgi:hypothetical protein
MESRTESRTESRMNSRTESRGGKEWSRIVSRVESRVERLRRIGEQSGEQNGEQSGAENHRHLLLSLVIVLLFLCLRFSAFNSVRHNDGCAELTRCFRAVSSDEVHLLSCCLLSALTSAELPPTVSWCAVLFYALFRAIN